MLASYRYHTSERAMTKTNTATISKVQRNARPTRRVESLRNAVAGFPLTNSSADSLAISLTHKQAHNE